MKCYPQIPLIATAFLFLPLSDRNAMGLPGESDQQLASLGAPHIETLYPRDTGIKGDVHTIASLPNGELLVLSDNSSRVSVRPRAS